MPEQHAAFDGMNVSMQYATDGSVLRMSASTNLANGGRWSAFSYARQEQHAVSDVDALRALGLLSMYGAERPENSNAYQGGLSLSVPLGGRMNLDTTHWVAHGVSALGAGDRGRASGSRVALGFNALDSLSLSLGTGVSRESDAVLGSIGRGAMALSGADNRTLALGIDYKATDALRLFARHQQGRLNVSTGGVLVQAFSRVRTRETAFGMAYAGNGWTAAAVVSSPLHVTEPGHVRGASSEYAAMAHWVKAF